MNKFVNCGWTDILEHTDLAVIQTGASLGTL